MFVASYTIDFSSLLRMITVSEMVTTPPPPHRQIQTSLSLLVLELVMVIKRPKRRKDSKERCRKRVVAYVL